MKKEVFLGKKSGRQISWRIMAAGMATAILLVLLAGGFGFEEKAAASTPTSGNISAVTGTSTMWAGSIVAPAAAANGEPSCVPAVSCDTYTLTVNGVPGDWTGKRIRIRFTWALPSNDYDMVVRKESNGVPGHQGDGVGATQPYDQTIGTSGNGTNTEEEVVIDPSISGTGDYYITAVYFAGGGAADQYMGSASVFNISTNLPSGSCAVPTFDNYQPPVGYPRRDGSGEPSIGVNWNTGNVMTMSRLRGNRTTFDDSTSPANPTTTSWFSQTSPAIVTGLDPILFTDPVTGRTIGGELQGAGGATNGFLSDDDLTSVNVNFTTGGAVQGFDHQTIGGGPPNPAITGRQPVTAYPHLIYYASQQIAYGSVSTSFDGGLTYGTAVTAYTLAQCGGLHGHIKVAPDGTVYLPNKNCGGKAAVVVSQDNGLTWSVRPVPTSSSGDNDPSVGIGAGGRIYVGYTASDKHMRVAVSDDKGLTWRDDYDLGLGVSPNLTATVFPAVVAGDNDRAAVFFLGTASTNPGDPTGDDSGTPYAGTWYPFMATTCDGGRSWSVVRADNDPLNPGQPNPVQQGVVCTSGTTCPAGTRNLLDFNDLTVDSRGRILAVYADGCNFDHPCINILDNSGTKAQNQGIARLTIIRQRGGMRLFSAFDPGGPAAPTLSPPVVIDEKKYGYELSWATPDGNGAELESYRIYRGSVRGGEGEEQLVAEIKASRNTYQDRILFGQRGRQYYYKVTAVNKYGESPRNQKFFPR